MKETVKHLAIIMDGNGRWAKSHGLPRGAGHKAGIKAVHEVLRGCEEHHIPHLTLFAFSSENWRRPKSEVSFLMELFVSTLQKELDELVEKGIRLRFIGDVSAFEADLRHRILLAESKTCDNGKLFLNIAVNYGGRWDIAQAAARLARDVAEGRVDPEKIDADKFGQYVCLADMPEPDLLIRTGGEFRISNFLNWQLAYTELYFTSCLWPDFDQEELKKAVDWYDGRQRRFGKTPEQIAAVGSPKINHA
ncbi:MAG TPA: polyprenyl diphosphate synthase [Gammaproteobacteria bacterium]